MKTLQKVLTALQRFLAILLAVSLLSFIGMTLMLFILS